MCLSHRNPHPLFEVLGAPRGTYPALLGVRMGRDILLDPGTDQDGEILPTGHPDQFPLGLTRQCLLPNSQVTSSTFSDQLPPSIEGHRGKTFVVAIPSFSIENERLFNSILEDILVLVGLGVRIVLVYGCTSIVTQTLEERGLEAQFVGGYRVTDGPTMNVAMEVAGTIQLMIESRLSQGPSISVVRKHTRDSNQFHFAPPFSVISRKLHNCQAQGCRKWSGLWANRACALHPG